MSTFDANNANLAAVRRLLKQAQSLELSSGALQRLKWFLYCFEHDGNVSLTCRHFGIARSTFLRWASRFDAERPETLEEHSRCPKTVRTPETDPRIVALIRALRQQHPTMGKVPLARVLRSEYGVTVSESTVGRVIARHRLFFAETQSHAGKRGEEITAVPTQRPDTGTDDSFPLFEPGLTS